MDPYVVGQAAGALISQFFLAALFHLISGWFPNTAIKLVGIHIAAGAIGILISANGSADGGTLNFSSAPMRAGASALLLCLDWLRTRYR